MLIIGVGDNDGVVNLLQKWNVTNLFAHSVLCDVLQWGKSDILFYTPDSSTYE
jgi:hypothetical protein